MDTVNIAGVDIYSGTWDKFIALNKNILFLTENKSLVISSTSVHGVIEAQTDIYFKDILNSSYLLNSDGKPLVLMGKLLGKKIMQQIRGPDVLPRICDLTQNSHLRHYFYGGKD